MLIVLVRVVDELNHRALRLILHIAFIQIKDCSRLVMIRFAMQRVDVPVRVECINRAGEHLVRLISAGSQDEVRPGLQRN